VVVVEVESGCVADCLGGLGFVAELVGDDATE